MNNEQHELVGQLLHCRNVGMVYRVEAVNEDAFPPEQELTLRPVYACRKTLANQSEPDDKKRSAHSRANMMSGTGHHSIRWAKQIIERGPLAEADVDRMKENDQ